MPIFEFRCAECGGVFEKLLMRSEEEISMCCPHCKSETLDRVVSRTHYAMSVGKSGKQPTVTTKSCGSSNQCVTLELPGHSR